MPQFKRWPIRAVFRTLGRNGPIRKEHYVNYREIWGTFHVLTPLSEISSFIFDYNNYVGEL